MKVPTTVSLSAELVAALAARAPDPERCSELVETAIRAYLLRLRRRDSSSDLAIINANAEALNEEAEDVLSYQVVP